MNIYAWIGIIGILLFTYLPLCKKTNRTKKEFLKAAATTLVVLGILTAVLIFHINYLFALLVGFMIFILLDKKTYTKVRLIIYGSIALLIIITAYFLLRDNPDYVLNHLEKYPQMSSFYAAQNGDELIVYEADTVRPLASTVKILVAAEYAMQVEAGKQNPDAFIPLADLDRFYVRNTDGGAHASWLEALKDDEKIKDGKVTLHEVAKGMITYSSNANTDYLINVLGTHEIDNRAQQLGLTQHEPIYPLVGALLIPLETDAKTVESLESIPMEKYRQLAMELSGKMQTGEIQANELSYNASLDIQRVWSNRLIGATARDYGRLLNIISNDELPETAAGILRDLMEWPMEFNRDNAKRFRHLGAKGGSTAFILNDALYADELEGNQFVIVLLMDDLNLWQSFLLQHNMNSFESKFIGSETFRKKVMSVLGKG
ncbi:D-alanyl-D-alanine carboxypeptidase [Sporosarcina luteola]|nr:D-alanyl-D-alanine carboxypeptidase [Sporosarcina luteola]